MEKFDVVVVGAGQAGVQLVTSLTQSRYDGSICLIGDEDATPYERPPLSKAYLFSDGKPESLAFRDPSFWEQNRIELMLGTVVEAVDATAKIVRTSKGTSIGYGHLVWAAGGSARQLPIPGSGLDGVLSIRNIEDADRLRHEMRTAKHAVIIGGGYIGLEISAALRKLGIQVTILEAQNRLLARVTSPVVSDFYAGLHRGNGADIRFEQVVTELVGRDGHVVGVRLADGETLPSDVVVVGIGLVPNTAPIGAAGALVSNGVHVDALCRTSLQDVFAIGDVALQANDFADGQAVRIESVPDAVQQAKTVANHLLGLSLPKPAAPWFWSNQYETKLKTIGLFNSHEETIVRGSHADGSFTVIYLKDGQVIAADCINRPTDFNQVRAILENRLAVDAEKLRDKELQIKEAVLPAEITV